MKGSAIRDDETDEPVFDRTRVEKRVGAFRLEKLVLTCLTGLSPFLVELVKLEGARLATVSVCDVEKGEMGFATEMMVGDLYDVWDKWEEAADPTSGPAKEDYQRMMVFLAAQLADAVRFLHHCGVVHHDLHPGNVLMGRDGYVKLTDFGMAFVDLDDSPASVGHFSYRNRMSVKSVGPPEDVWRKLVRDSGRSVRRGPLALNLDRRVDLHMLGYNLLRLDWPIDFSAKVYSDVLYDEKAPTFEEFAKTYIINRFPKTLDVRFGSFIRLLTMSQPQRRIGAENVDNILKHSIFRDIDFDLLRKKQLAAPLGPVLRRILEEGRVQAASGGDSISSPWNWRSAEARYSRGLDRDDRLFFFKKFENS